MSKYYLNLINQLNRLYRHNRAGSYRTRARYYEAMQRFCRFLAERYHLERLANIGPKHLVAYVAFLQESGKSPSTIKTDLAAIRFFHDLMAAPRHQLPDNGDLLLQRRTFGGVDRTWSREEFQRMLAEALRLGREDYVTILYLARYAGLRIHECFRIDTATAEQAIREGAITIKGKGGLVRTVPLHPILVSRLELALQATPRGHKLFVPDGVQTHTAIQQLQSFIRTHRPGAQDTGSARPMTFHGLRHTCAAEWYQERIAAGATPYEARKAVSQLLGHGRDDVTRIYLASLQEPRTAAPLSGAAAPFKMDGQEGGR
ncbi:tyrosine-type recombinase/integrase [Oscillibacter valericigenes]|uniref:Tyrosine-type recombinase/integrase n=1 Tax=Oscillibacter valericigenes TaxID=351091 RepID=A0ABS2FX12_9FIRM|nr:tyrosine-type recombinase/integrase [Oscillibacter valericigenes]MBM6851571.1 tyrosine-type recombinase/integrase [Oscillibacter valericigenes]